MNCDCIEKKQLEIPVKGNYNGKRILSAELISGTYTLGESNLGIVTTSKFELEVEGMKKPQIIDLAHSFCPFCGVKIEQQ